MRTQRTSVKEKALSYIDVLNAISDALIKMDSRISDMERQSYTGIDCHVKKELSQIQEMVQFLKIQEH